MNKYECFDTKGVGRTVNTEGDSVHNTEHGGIAIVKDTAVIAIFPEGYAAVKTGEVTKDETDKTESNEQQG